MTPIEFVVFGGDSEPNQPVYQVAEAMTQPIKIIGPDGEYEAVSYYRDGTQMVLEISRKVELFPRIDRKAVIQELAPEMTEHQKKMEREAAEQKAFAAKPKSRHLWWR